MTTSEYVTTDIILKANITYSMRVLNSRAIVRVYVEGDTAHVKDFSPSVINTFTPLRDGVLKLKNLSGWQNGDIVTIEVLGECYLSKEITNRIIDTINSSISGALDVTYSMSKYLFNIHTKYVSLIWGDVGDTYTLTGIGNNTYNVYTDTDTTHFITLGINQSKTFTVTTAGYLTFYWLTGSDDTQQIKISGSLRKKIDTLESTLNLIDNSLAPLSFDINTLKLSDSLKAYPNSMINEPIVGESSVEDYESLITSSLYGDLYAPFKIRNSKGKLLYNLRCDGVTLLDDKHLIAFAFGSDGKYLKNIYAKSWKTAEGQGTFDEDVYYILVREYKNPHNTWSVLPTNIEWLNPSNKIAYTVGSGGHYTGFLEMLNDLQNDITEKTVYILPGEYDIWEEYGGDDYFNSIKDPGSLNWRDVCPVVPPNTTIKGIGEVTLKFMPTAEQIGNQAKAFLFSPLNVSGTCTIENIKIECQNCRYAIHDETSGQSQFDEATHIFKNVRAHHYGGTYGVKMTYGAGHNRKMHFEFKDCEFWSYTGSCAWSSHDWPATKNQASTFIFDNCLFIHPNNSTATAFQLLSSSKVGRLDNIRLSNCYISTGKAAFGSEDTSGTQYTQGYDVTMIGCNPVTWIWGSHIPEKDRIVPKQYNIINNK